MNINILKRPNHLGILTFSIFKEIVEKMQEVGVTAISGETIVKNGKAELLAPMSAIAGQRSAIMVLTFILKRNTVVKVH